METKIKMCSRCRSLLDKRKTDSYAVWYFYKTEGGVYMVECNSCHFIRVWKQFNKRRDSKYRIQKIISNLDPEYLIWKLK